MARRIPDNVKALHGEKRPSRINGNAPDADQELPEAPDYLNDRATEWFYLFLERLEEMGTASKSDTEMLALLSITQADYEAYNLKLKKSHTYRSKTTTGQLKYVVRPEVQLRKESAAALERLLAHFGLSPASRGRVTAPKRPGRNPWSSGKPTLV